jgi:GTPase
MQKLPLITIVGIPNTGKSTLFNRILGQRKALVHSKPGMTRDIYKKECVINESSFYIQDTGGFFLNKDIITEQINKRIFQEAKKSDLIIFLFDGKRELLGFEKDLFLDIRRLCRNIIPVLNKVDNLDSFIIPTSYYDLKLEYLLISAEHNYGMDELYDTITKALPKAKSLTNLGEIPPRISIIGKPNVGKSSLVNKILNDEWSIVTPIPGTTRDSVDVQITRNNQIVEIVDNAGIRKIQKISEETEKAAVVRADKDIRNSDIVVFIVDVSRKIDQNDLFIAGKISKSTKPAIIVANKWDLINDNQKAETVIQMIKKRFNALYYAPIILVSALSGKNIFSIIDEALRIHSKITTRIKPNQLYKLIQSILSAKKLLTENNRPFLPKYIAVESYSPFFIQFHVHQPVKLKATDELYLKKRIGEDLELDGIPIYFKVIAKK